MIPVIQIFGYRKVLQDRTKGAGTDKKINAYSVNATTMSTYVKR